MGQWSVAVQPRFSDGFQPAVTVPARKPKHSAASGPQGNQAGVSASPNGCPTQETCRESNPTTAAFWCAPYFWFVREGNVFLLCKKLFNYDSDKARRRSTQAAKSTNMRLAGDESSLVKKPFVDNQAIMMCWG